MSSHNDGDSAEQRALAAKQRDAGFLDPSDPEYDAKLTRTWGGPPMQWFDKAMADFPAKYPGGGKTALVTGSTGGIGFYVAKLLAACGYSVIVPARPDLVSEAQGARRAIEAAVLGAKVVVPEVTLDLRSFASVRCFAKEVRSAHPCIDVLCLNAGRGGSINDPREVTPDGFEAIMQVNATSQFLLTCELLPLLEASLQSRVVCQSSGARFNIGPQLVSDLDGIVNRSNQWAQYSLSKACMCTLARALNKRLDARGSQNVIACVSEPGLASTGVNIQHNLVKSLGLTARGLKTTNMMHDRAGHHAADGALPMTLASLIGARNDFFCTEGNRASSLEQAAFKIRPEGSSEPMLWDERVCDLFWVEATRMTGAEWPL